MFARYGHTGTPVFNLLIAFGISIFITYAIEDYVRAQSGKTVVIVLCFPLLILLGIAINAYYHPEFWTMWK